MEMVKHFTTTDLHAAGEPLRVITAGIPYLKGKTMLEKQGYFNENYGYVKKILLSEPRGHLGMKGCIITPPDDAASDCGILFLQHEEVSSLCSHSIVAVVTYLLETGVVRLSDEKQQVIIDTLAGKVITNPVYERSQVKSVSFDYLPAYVYKENITLNILKKEMTVNLAFCDSFYAIVNAAKIDLNIEIDRLPELHRWSKYIRNELTNILPDNQSIKGVVFCESPPLSKADIRQVTVFDNGQIERSPFGAGSATHMALLKNEGKLGVGDSMIYESIVGASTKCKISSINEEVFNTSVISRINARAFITGMHQFVVDPSDPLFDGFLLK
ncbi:proline racemase family protein [Chengkuizengella axinellae]|uniref:Proline racemase family protein n=1 Tax=Chengkuizengella axinellae TaxID=3064388 RepID=A0ABT9J1P2_9BACL|nr:proline racemase family protein [Chengkuizengella sp. 2205SS18-9]MDP5275527.1 proline racemase family protein [Chengkuizengella sp. 2205SS18-9]